MGSISKYVAWRAIPVAAFAAGLAFLAVHMVASQWLYEIDPFFILHYFSSLVLGSEVLVEPTVTSTVVGLATHLALSILFTFIITIVIHRWGFVIGVIGGGLLGLAIYSINFYTMTVFFEWMFALNNNVLVVSHVIFGVFAGGVYELLDDYDEGLSGEGS